ncbi:hypothetical protein F4819DRAFT_21718 [Hypoxylon fuscum]|nr:hypothetical protein F4819DRAFT_21718 [Hypoxylon fuscum]
MSREDPCGSFVDVLKRCSTFDDLPDDDSDPFCERKICLHRLGPSDIPSSKGDVENRKHEEYLRSKWQCDEAMPETFDPYKLADKLEVALQGQSKSHAEANDQVLEDDESHCENHLSDSGYGSLDLYSEEANTSSESLLSNVSVTESLDSDEQLEGYEDEVNFYTASSASITRVSLDASAEVADVSLSVFRPVTETERNLERNPTPRIRRGSKPPLSRSAFSGVGLPRPMDGSQGQRSCETLSGYPQAPRYFPSPGKLRKG